MHTEFPNELILSNPKDNVATARTPIKAETLLLLPKGKMIRVKEEIRFGHKIALRQTNKE